MPKLDRSTAAAVEAAEAVHGGGDFEPLPEGKYLGRLSDVSVRDNKDKYGAVQWSAEFQNLVSLETRTQAPGRQWLSLTLPTSDQAPSNYTNGQEKWGKYQAMVQGRLNAFFDAFGFTTDSDTDEMLNEYAIIVVKVVTAQAGKNEGKLVNRVVDIEAVPEDFDFEAHGVLGSNPDEAF